MAKLAFHRRTTQRILSVAPHLKYIAFYHRSEERLNACMREYGDRSFVYVLSCCYMDQEFFLYVGKSKSQYSRCLRHTKMYEFDNIYLFEYPSEWLDESERAVIFEFRPIFNRKDNPDAVRLKQLLKIDYDAVHSRESIERYLLRISNYKEMGLYGFALPVVLYAALEGEAAQQGITCGEFVRIILEQVMLKQRAMNLDCVNNIKTNLVTTKSYGVSHARSREQVKQYLHQHERMPGAAKIGRDWIIPYDTKFPQDLRDMRKKSM